MALFCLLATLAGGTGAALALSVNSSESYWLVSSSGQVFAFGQARDYGSEAGKRFHGHIIGIVSTPNGKGYWLISSTGQRFGFGDAHLYKYTATKLQKFSGHINVRNLRGRIVGVALAKLPAARVATATTTTKTVATTTGPTTQPVTTTVTIVTTSTSPSPTTTSSTPALPVPAATAQPTVAANGLSVGDVLTASSDTWANSPTSYGYQWDDCDSSGARCLPITADASSQTYTLGPSDIGDTIRLVETATNATGTSQPDTSIATALVTAGPPADSVSPTITTTSLPSAPDNLSYSANISVGGGVSPYTWEVATGALPDGLTLDSSTGAISGTPTASGSFEFDVTVTGSDGGTATAAYTLTVTPPTPPTVTTTTVPYPIENDPFNTTLSAAGGYAPYSWALAGGSSLPSGLTLSSGGTISGTATTYGTFSFTVVVTGADQGTASITYLMLVSNPSESYNWSGYVEHTSGAFTSATGTFTVPNLDVGDDPDSALAEWVGIDGDTNSDLIQAGVENDPTDGTFAWWEVLPATETPIAEPIDPGDTVTVHIDEVTPVTTCSSSDTDDPVTSGVDWDITISDATQGWSYPVTLCYNGPGSSAEWIAEAPEEQVTQHHQTVDEIVPLAAFNPDIVFTNLSTSSAASELDYMTMVQPPDAPICVDTTAPAGCTTPTNLQQQATPSVLDQIGFDVAYGSTEPAAP